MTTQDKLEKLYEVKEILHPLTKLMVENMFDGQQSQLSDADAEYVETIYEAYKEWEDS